MLTSCGWASGMQREMLTCEEFGELLRKESRPKYTKMEPTPCRLTLLT